MLANRALELAAHYNMALEPCQISTEVPDLVKAHLHCTTAYNPGHSIRGRSHSRGNQYHWYNRQSYLLQRYSQQSQRSDVHFILIEITVILIIIMMASIIHLILLEMSTIQVIIRYIL